MPPNGQYQRCEICKNRQIPSNGIVKFMSKFPLDEDRCKQWVKVTGNEDLAYIPIEKLHELKYVCEDHFLPKDFNKKKTRLRKWAVPSLFLSQSPLPDHLLEEFPCHLAKSYPTLTIKTSVFQEHSYCDLQFQENDQHHVISPRPIESAPSETADYQSMLHDHDESNEEEECLEDCVPLSAIRLSAKSSQNNEIISNHKCCALQPQDRSLLHQEPSSSANIFQDNTLQHNKCKQQPPVTKKTGKNKDPDSARNKKLLKRLQASKAKMKPLAKKAKLLDSIQSPFLKALVMCTAKNQNREQQAKRWNDTVKVFALTILKMSPEVFTYLRQLIPLPSPRTLETLLKKITLEPDANITL